MARSYMIGLLALAGIATTPAAQAQRAAPKYFTVAFYNMENFCDTLNDPAAEDDEFTPGGANNWTSDRFMLKTQNLAKVVQLLDDTLTDPAQTSHTQPTRPYPLGLLGMCEVENSSVVEYMLMAANLHDRFKVVLFDSKYHRGVDVALAYDAELFELVRAVPHPITPDTAQPYKFSRDILQVDLKLSGTREELSVFVNHWPSRRNPESERVHTAKHLRGIIDTLQMRKPGRHILVMGDLNDEPTSKSLATTLGGRTTTFGIRPHQLYNTMAPADSLGLGTYSFNNEWNMLDNILVSGTLVRKADHPRGLRYELNSAQVFSPAMLREQDPRWKGQPLRSFAGRKYLGGYSDHFPIRIRMTYNP